MISLFKEVLIASETMSWSQVGKMYLPLLREVAATGDSIDKIQAKDWIMSIHENAWDMDTKWGSKTNAFGVTRYVELDKYTNTPLDDCPDIGMKSELIPTAMSKGFKEVSLASRLSEVYADKDPDQVLMAIKANTEGYYSPEDIEDYEIDTSIAPSWISDDIRKEKHIFPRNDWEIGSDVFGDYKFLLSGAIHYIQVYLENGWKITKPMNNFIKFTNDTIRDWGAQYALYGLWELEELLYDHDYEFDMQKLKTSIAVINKGSNSMNMELYEHLYADGVEESIEGFERSAHSWDGNYDDYSKTFELMDKEILNTFSDDPLEKAQGTKVFHQAFMNATQDITMVDKGIKACNEHAWKVYWKWQYDLFPTAAVKRQTALANGKNIIEANKAFYDARNPEKLEIIEISYKALKLRKENGEEILAFPKFLEPLVKDNKLFISSQSHANFKKAVVDWFARQHTDKAGNPILFGNPQFA